MEVNGLLRPYEIVENTTTSVYLGVKLAHAREGSAENDRYRPRGPKCACKISLWIGRFPVSPGTPKLGRRTNPAAALTLCDMAAVEPILQTKALRMLTARWHPVRCEGPRSDSGPYFWAGSVAGFVL
jgi:hypothetical protein